jgi:hypothetical protein
VNEKLEMGLPQSHASSQTSLAISWCLSAVATFLCLVLALASTHFIQPFTALFQGLNVALPWPTRFLVATQYWLLPSFYLGLALMAILFQFSDRGFRAKRMAAIRIFLTALMAAGLVLFVLYLPLLTVASNLSRER